MSIKKKVFSDSLVTMVRSAVSVTRGLIVIPLITNLLGTGSYGIWATSLAFVSIISTAGSFYLPGALIRYGSQDQNKENTFIDIVTFIFVGSSIIFVFLIFIGNLLSIEGLLNGEVDNETQLVFAASLLVFSSMTWKINLNFPRAKGKVKTYDILKLTIVLFESVGLVFLFFLGGSIIDGLLLLSAIRLILSVTLFLAIVISYNIPWPSIDRYEMYIRYSAPMIPSTISGKLLLNADKYIILYFLSPTAVGIYTVAYQICSVLAQLTEILESTLYPTISKAWDDGKQEKISQLFNSILRIYVIFAIPAAVGLILLARPILMLISTEEIAFEGVILVPVLVIGFAAKGAYQPLKKILTASEDTNKIAIATISGTILNILLNIVLINYAGLIGAAVASALSFSLILLLVYRFSKEQLMFSLPYNTIIKSGIAATVMAGVLVIIPIEGIYLQLIFYPIIGVVIYFTTLTATGEFGPEEKEYIRQKIQKLELFN